MATLTDTQQDTKKRKRKEKDTLGCTDEGGINLTLIENWVTCKLIRKIFKVIIHADQNRVRSC